MLTDSIGHEPSVEAAKLDRLGRESGNENDQLKQTRERKAFL